MTPKTVTAALRYWQAKKLSLDAARPDFTADQLRELEAAESRLLAIDVAALAAPPAPTPDETAQRVGDYAQGYDEGFVAGRAFAQGAISQLVKQIELQCIASSDRPMASFDRVHAEALILDAFDWKGR